MITRRSLGDRRDVVCRCALVEYRAWTWECRVGAGDDGGNAHGVGVGVTLVADGSVVLLLGSTAGALVD